MTDQLRFDGRVAIVTGGGRGVGRAHALALAERGAKVVVNDLGGSAGGTGASEEPADQVVAEITSAGGEAIADHSDVSRSEAGRTLLDAALSSFGRLDIVVSNAGIVYEPHAFEQTTLESLERMWRVHVGGTFNVVHAAWQHFMERGYGRIITTSSSGALYGIPESPEYSSAKGAILSLTRAMAHESGAHGIRVNAILPAAATRMLVDVNVDADAMAAMQAALDPNLVPATMLWLAHERCTVNGHMYEVGAGRTARVVIGEDSGYWSSESTPEDLLAHEDEVQSTADLLSPPDALQWAGWLLGEAAKRSGRSASAQSATPT